MTTEVQQTTSLFNKMRMASKSNNNNNNSNSSSNDSKSNKKGLSSEKREMHHFLVSGHRFDVDTYYQPNIAVGSGAYGVVCSAVDNRYKQKVAIKKCANAFEDIIDGKRILREIKLLQFFDHENIIKLSDMIPPKSITNLRNFSDVYMVLEHMESDLHKIIYSRNKLTDEHYQYFMFQLLLGLKYMFSANVIHRDLKPSNLLVNGDCKLKICDFGLARGMDWNNELTEYVVTRWYRAPEIMYTCQDYDEKIDIWSVGTILAEMLLRKPLFAGDHYIQQLNMIFDLIGTPQKCDWPCVTNPKALKYIKKLEPKGAVRFESYFKNASPLAIDLLKKMLVFNPKKRIGVDAALKHPYFSKLCNKELLAKSVCVDTNMDCSFEMKCRDRQGLKEQTMQTCLQVRAQSNLAWAKLQQNKEH